MKQRGFGISDLFSTFKLLYCRDKLQEIGRDIISRLLRDQDEMLHERNIWPPDTYHAHFLDLGIAVRGFQIEIIKEIFSTIKQGKSEATGSPCSVTEAAEGIKTIIANTGIKLDGEGK